MSMDGGWCKVCGKWEMEADEGYCEEHVPNDIDESLAEDNELGVTH